MGEGSTLPGSWSFSAIGWGLPPGVSITPSPPCVPHSPRSRTKPCGVWWACCMSPPGLEADGSDLRPKENPKGEAPQEEAGGEGAREAHPSPGVPTTDGPS